MLRAYWSSTQDHLEELFKHHHFGRLRGPNISPLGKEMQAAGAKIVFETADANEMQRLLAHPDEIDALLKRGAERAAERARPIMADVRRLVGFVG